VDMFAPMGEGGQSEAGAGTLTEHRECTKDLHMVVIPWRQLLLSPFSRQGD
jgi:hypothetical protein